MKKYIFAIIRILEIPQMFRYFFQRKAISVIYYHDVDPISFEEHLKYLKKKYSIIDIYMLRDFLYGKLVTLPKFSMLITFDDGHIGNYQLLKLIREYKIRPTIFLTSGLIGTCKRFWFNIPFKDTSLKEKLKKFPDCERLNIINNEYNNYIDKDTPEALTYNQITNMSDAADFQSHTKNHPCLPQTEDKVSLAEIAESKNEIEKILGKQVIAIAYPNGDFGEREIRYAMKSGYQLGFSSKGGFISNNSNPFELPRLSMNDTKNINDFIIRSSGLWFKIKQLINFFKNYGKIN